MPAIGGLHLLIAIGLAIHAMKTGRPYWWLFILLFVPGLGSLAYVVVEIIPELLRSRRARKLGSNVETLIDPDKEWRERVKQAELVDSVDAKRALAEECERRGKWQDAVELYEAAATGIFADDPIILLGLARAQLGAGDAQTSLATLDEIDATQTQFRSQEAHLIRAKALEALGRIDEALEEYADVSRYYSGFEARTRYGLLLMKRGRIAEARKLFQDVVRASSARPLVVTPADKEWVKISKGHLR